MKVQIVYNIIHNHHLISLNLKFSSLFYVKINIYLFTIQSIIFICQYYYLIYFPIFLY